MGRAPVLPWWVSCHCTSQKLFQLSFASVWNTYPRKVHLLLLALYKHTVSGKLLNVLCTNFFAKYLLFTLQECPAMPCAVWQKSSAPLNKYYRWTEKPVGVYLATECQKDWQKGQSDKPPLPSLTACAWTMSILYSLCPPLWLMGFVSSDLSSLNMEIEAVHWASSVVNTEMGSARKQLIPFVWGVSLRMGQVA